MPVLSGSAVWMTPATSPSLIKLMAAPAEFPAHGIDGGLIRHLFRAAPAQSRGGHRGLLRYPHDFER